MSVRPLPRTNVQNTYRTKTHTDFKIPTIDIPLPHTNLVVYFSHGQKAITRNWDTEKLIETAGH